jgi:tetratricopeptide (TPR) repeat protein
MEARAYLSLGVARMRTRNDLAGAEAFRSALAIARDAQALDIAASASMNLGVIGLRSGDFASAHEALSDALRLYTTLRNNGNRLAALYNLANLTRERGDAPAAAALYRETTTLANQLGATDIAIGAYAGEGWAAMRQDDDGAARVALAAAQGVLGNRHDWWFQGRELLESLVIRLAARDEYHDLAAARFHAAVERLEAIDVYAAAWLAADCAAEIAEHGSGVWSAVQRLAAHPTVIQFLPLSARFTALRDMAERAEWAHLRR